jgi:hypothetical protein
MTIGSEETITLNESIIVTNSYIRICSTNAD